MTPIWKKRREDVEDADYHEFYKATFHDFEDPARTISFHAEGALEYDALLFIPAARRLTSIARITRRVSRSTAPT